MSEEYNLNLHGSHSSDTCGLDVTVNMYLMKFSGTADPCQQARWTVGSLAMSLRKYFGG